MISHYSHYSLYVTKYILCVMRGSPILRAGPGNSQATTPGQPGQRFGPPAGGPDGPASPPSRVERVLDAIPAAAGLLCAAEGLTVMTAWFVRATAILLLGGPHPMVFNTALAVTLTGIALASRWPRAVLTVAVLDAALGAVTLAEYALGRGLGIDQLIAADYLRVPDLVPGRIYADSAVCLTLLGAGLLVWGPGRPRRRPAALAAAGSLIGAIAVTAITGYATGTPTEYTWARVTGMPLLAAAAMLILAFSLLSMAWRDTPGHLGGLPRWLPLPAGALVFGIAGTVWMAIAGGGGAKRSAGGAPTDAVAVLGLIMAGLVAVMVWLAQQADQRRRMAVTSTAEAAEATMMAERNQDRLYRFLDAMPVGVFAATPDGRIFYSNDEANHLVGQGVVADIGAGELAQAYGAFVIGTDRLYPTADLPIVRAGLGQSSHVDDMEIHHPDREVIPLEVWGCPVYGAGGEVDYALAVVADMSERSAREKVVTEQAALLDLAHDAILVRDQDSRIVYWNAGAERLYGYTRAEAVGRTSHELLRTKFPAPVTDIEADTAGEGRWEGELIHRCADGRTIVVESRWAAMYLPDRSLKQYLEVNRDVTARKEAEHETLRRVEEIRDLNATLEQQVRQRTVHLRQANKNLAAFTYSIAHDLRTPLRAMSGYAETLAEEYGDQLGETGIGYTGRIQAATEHMATLIDDLLQLSRVSQAEINLQQVDLSAEVTAICGRLRAGDPDRQVLVTVQDGVRVTADRALILIVLENLLENAWKFSAGRDDAGITFATTTVDGAPCCYVRDNGIGFDFAYADKLFQPFQRLHPAGEFPGTGTGLATVQRIVERHGGRTWAEGSVGGGATFYFTLDALSQPG